MKNIITYLKENQNLLDSKTESIVVIDTETGEFKIINKTKD